MIGGLPILVDEIYLKCYNLPPMVSREMEHIPRPITAHVESKKRTLDNTINGEIESSRRMISSITLSKY